MLRIFVSNNPLVVVLYILVLVVARVLYFVGDQQVDIQYGFIISFIESFFGEQLRVWLLSLGAVLQFIQALFINNIVNEHKLSRKKNYVAGLLYLLFCCLFYETLCLSHQMIALSFCLWAFKKLFDAQGKEKPFGHIFDSGTLLSVASIFYFPCVLFLPVAYVALGIVRPFSYREWALLLAGLVMPIVAIAGFGYVFFESTPLLQTIVSLEFTQLHSLSLHTGSSVSLVVLLFLTITAGLLLPRALFATLIQVRKVVGCLLVFSLVSFVLLFISGEGAVHTLLFVFFPLAILWMMPLTEIRKPILGDALVVILILTLALNSHSSYFLSFKLF